MQDKMSRAHCTYDLIIPDFRHKINSPIEILSKEKEKTRDPYVSIRIRCFLYPL